MRPILGGFGSLWVPRELQIYLCQFLMEVHTGLRPGPAFLVVCWGISVVDQDDFGGSFRGLEA